MKNPKIISLKISLFRYILLSFLSLFLADIRLGEEKFLWAKKAKKINIVNSRGTVVIYNQREISKLVNYTQLEPDNDR